MNISELIAAATPEERAIETLKAIQAQNERIIALLESIAEDVHADRRNW